MQRNQCALNLTRLMASFFVHITECISEGHLQGAEPTTHSVCQGNAPSWVVEVNWTNSSPCHVCVVDYGAAVHPVCWICYCVPLTCVSRASLELWNASGVSLAPVTLSSPDEAAAAAVKWAPRDLKAWGTNCDLVFCGIFLIGQQHWSVYIRDFKRSPI